MTREIITKDYDDHLLSEFLTLIKNKFRIVDKANYFLELNGINSINIAVANQRDAVSHFVSFLKSPQDVENQKKQLGAAEEHLRRAVLEPYQVALEFKKADIYQHQDDLILMGIDKESLKKIEEDIVQIQSLYQIGRDAKKRNIWDEGFEEGVKSFIQGFNKANQLERELRIQKVELKKNISLKKNKSKQYVAVLLVFIIGIAVGLLL